jgi:uncharacterized iron-regulated protein
MDDFVGKPGIVYEAQPLNPNAGVRVWCQEVNYWFHFPWFCLERVKAEPVKVVLNPTYTAEVISKTEVEIGGQTIPVENIRKLLAAVDSLWNS